MNKSKLFSTPPSLEDAKLIIGAFRSSDQDRQEIALEILLILLADRGLKANDFSFKLIDADLEALRHD